MQLDVPIAAVERLVRVMHDIRGGAVAKQARVRGEIRARSAAEEAVERLPGELARDVPQRDVDAGECVDRGAVAADAVQ